MRRSRVVVGVAAVLSVALGVRLGLWQLDRASQKIARHDALVAREQLPVLDAAALARTPADADAQQFRRTLVTGRWIADRTVFLDNRQMDARTGFVVVTPLAIEPSAGTSAAGPAAVVLVQRGFALRRFDDRSALPALDTPPGVVRIEGTVAGSPSRLYDFGPGASGPIRQNLDLDAYARETGLPLLPVTILQRDPARSPPPGDGLARHWPVPAADVQKHYGYAFQWFMIAAVIAFLYVWFQLVRRPRSAS